MRGGRGGRGRFSGRGSVTQDLIRDNMEDLGMDLYQRFDDGQPPPLYPSIPIPAPSALTSDDIFHIQKCREISHRCQSSSYHLKRKVPSVDIQRYSDRYTQQHEIAVIDTIKATNKDLLRFIPSELVEYKSAVNGGDSTITKSRANLNFAKLEMAEATGLNKGVPEKKDDGSDIDEAGEGQDVDEFEGDDDYGVDHYASDDGGDNEADEAYY